MSPLSSITQPPCKGCSSHTWQWNTCGRDPASTLPSWVAVILSLSHVWLSATPWTAAHQASLSFTITWSLLKFMSIESVMPSNHLSLCHPCLLLHSVFPSIRAFPSDFSGLISFRIYWFGLLAIQGTLKRLQHHNSKAWVLLHSAFFMV